MEIIGMPRYHLNLFNFHQLLDIAKYMDILKDVSVFLDFFIYMSYHL